MKKVIFLTVAYNAQNTIKRAILSVLNQTWKDFKYWIVDNGSTDKTRHDIIRFAEKDERIIPFFHDANDIWRGFDYIMRIAKEYPDNWLVILDSDDEYNKNFLFDIINFMNDNDLDFATAGSDFVNATNNQIIGSRGIARNLILSRITHSFLGDYHALMRPVWAKLIPLNIVSQLDFSDYYRIRYGADTAFVLDIIEKCKRFGIMSGSHHKYYVNLSSDSYTWDYNRLAADSIMYEHGIKHCIAMWGYVSSKNKYFLYAVYSNAIKDTIKVLAGAKIKLAEKFKALREILENEITMQMLCSDDFSIEIRKDIINNIFNIIKPFEHKIQNFEDGIWLGITLSSFLENQNDYIKYSKMNILYLINDKCYVDAERELLEWEQLLPKDKDLLNLRKLLDFANK